MVVPMVSLWCFTILVLLYDSLALRGHKGGQDRAILGRGLYMLVILTELQNEETFRKSTCLSGHWNSNYQIRQEVSFVVYSMVVSTQF